MRPTHMLAARLHGPRDMRVDNVPTPGPPAPGHVLLRVLQTGVCGSDLHSYQDARIGDTPVEAPLVLGHEFSAVVEEVGPGAVDGWFQPLSEGVRVAVDPAQPCWRCELCQQGHPNLCRRLHFCGNFPDGGSLCQWMHMPGQSCFPVPGNLTDTEAALLEPLGVALFAVDLAKIRIGASVAILGAGPIGLLLVQLAKLAGADQVFVSEVLPHRLRLAQHLGGTPVHSTGLAGAQEVLDGTEGKGVDVALEAAWGDESIGTAAEMLRAGGRLVLVGIPSDDRLQLKHSTARRKGLTLVMSRRTKHAYPRAMCLAGKGRVDLNSLVSHRFPLARTAEAFSLNAAYRDNVVKIMVES